MHVAARPSTRGSGEAMSALSDPTPVRGEARQVSGRRAADSDISAARGGALLVLATIASLIANYLFLLGAGRVLGSADYGTVAALAGLLTVVLLPTGAIQMAVSREVSSREALGERVESAAFVRRLAVIGAITLLSSHVRNAITSVANILPGS